jgi:hypothetical protein
VFSGERPFLRKEYRDQAGFLFDVTVNLLQAS